MRAGFLCPKCENFTCLHIRQDPNELHLKIWLFCHLPLWLLAKLYKSIAGPLSEAKTHWMVNWHELLASYQGLHSKFVSMMSPKCSIVENDGNYCWWRFKHTFSYSSNILGCMYCFWLFTLWFIDEESSFFHFFHKIMNIWSWRCFSFSKIRTFCNIIMIFKLMSQYFPALFKRIHNRIRSEEE